MMKAVQLLSHSLHKHTCHRQDPTHMSSSCGCDQTRLSYYANVTASYWSAVTLLASKKRVSKPATASDTRAGVYQGHANPQNPAKPCGTPPNAFVSCSSCSVLVAHG